jgi:hypothetical protein
MACTPRRLMLLGGDGTCSLCLSLSVCLSVFCKTSDGTRPVLSGELCFGVCLACLLKYEWWCDSLACMLCQSLLLCGACATMFNLSAMPICLAYLLGQPVRAWCLKTLKP